jgi:N-acetylmuramoyl-L-alanine amidase
MIYGKILPGVAAAAVVCVLSLLVTGTARAQQYPFTITGQPEAVSKIVSREQNISNAKQILAMSQRLDETYGDLYEKLKSGRRLVIFFGPAHGKYWNGYWEGAATNRISCTGVTEEYYSMLLARELYALLAANPMIEVRTTDDYLQVLKGRSDTYNNIFLQGIVQRALETNAFMAISQHLNNVAQTQKAYGYVNIPGIHITTDETGARFLANVRFAFRGFLTLYNRVDASGFSLRYAQTLKAKLIEKGMKSNAWENGCVGDERFTYFVDFPISLIYETGFICNPEEEAFLRGQENRKMIARAQYDTLLETTRDVFGVDISGGAPVKVKDTPEQMLTIFKLSRIALFYVKTSEFTKAFEVIAEIERLSDGFKEQHLVAYRDIRTIITQAESYYQTGRQLMLGNNHRDAGTYLGLAKRTINNRALLAALDAKYAAEASRLVLPATDAGTPVKLCPGQNFAPNYQRMPLNTPVIFPVEEKMSLEEAIEKALNPDRETAAKLARSLGNVWINGQKFTFGPGLYLVTLGEDLAVTNVLVASEVRLNPCMYQNHQYLKNSYFAAEERDRSL